jgi:hypothetical protein
MSELLDSFFLKTFDVIAQVYYFVKLNPYGRKLVDKCISSPQFKKIFEEADVHGNGALGPEEIYTLVLRFYILVAQYTFVIARHIPSRDDVLGIISHNDISKDGVIRFREFKTLVLVLCEGVATQLIAQLTFTVLFSPLLALSLTVVLKHAAVIFPSVAAQFWFIPSFLRNDKIELLCFVPMFNFLLLPYFLEYIFYIRSLRNPDKVRFVPDMSQFQAVPSPLQDRLEELLEAREEEGKGKDSKGEGEGEEKEKDGGVVAGEKKKNDDENGEETISDLVADTDTDIGAGAGAGSAGEASEANPSRQDSEDDLVILEKDEISKKDD